MLISGTGHATLAGADNGGGGGSGGGGDSGGGGGRENHALDVRAMGGVLSWLFWRRFKTF